MSMKPESGVADPESASSEEGIGLKPVAEVADPSNLALPKPYSAWTEQDKQSQRQAGQQMLQQLQSAFRSGKTEYVIPPGNYRFPDNGKRALITLQGLNHFRIVAKDVTFWMEAFKFGFELVDSRDVVFEGLTIDYDPQPYAQGSIIAVHDEKDRYIDFELDPGFLPPDQLLGKKPPNMPVAVFSPDGKDIKSWSYSKPSKIEKLGERTYRVYFRTRVVNGYQTAYKDYLIEKGDKIAVIYRNGDSAMIVNRSEGIVFNGLTVYSSPGLGIRETGSFGKGGGSKLTACQVVRRPNTGRLLSTAANAYHSAFTVKGPVIEGCEFAYAGDDMINLRGGISTVFEVIGEQELLIAPRQGFEGDLLLAPGAKLKIADQHTGGIRSEVTVTRVERVTDRSILDQAAQLKKELKLTLWSGDGVFRVWTDRPVDAAQLDYVFYGQNDSGGFTIRNNYFHHTPARGLLLQGANGVLENNKIEYTGAAGLIVGAELPWMAGGLPENIEISGNTFADNNSLHGLKAILGMYPIASVNVLLTPLETTGKLLPAALFRHIRITGNTIVRPQAAAVFIANAEDSEVSGNRIIQPAYGHVQGVGRNVGIDGNYGIIQYNGDNIAIENNTFEQKPEWFPGEVWQAGERQP
jgi:hypothetical protein